MTSSDIILSPELQDQANLYIEVSSLIYHLSPENIESTIFNFQETFEKMTKEELEVIDILYIFETFIRIRSSKSQIFSQFLKQLEKDELQTNSFNIIEFNHKILLPKLISFDDDYKIRPCNMYFLLKSIKTELFTISEILEKINEYHKTHLTFYYIHILHFAWFGPEIEKYDANLYKSYFQSVQKLREMTKWEPSLEPFFSHFETLKENDWNALKILREGVESTVCQIMEKDDPEFLQIKENSNVNKVYSINIYNPMLNIATGNASLLEISAFFGSIRCLKYLLLNDAKLRDGEALTSVAFGRFHLNDEHWNSMNFAVAGGNTEIIHLLEFKKANFNNCLVVALRFHQYLIFEWLFGLKKDNNNDLISLIQTCIDVNNVKSLLFLLDFVYSQRGKSSQMNFESLKLDKKLSSQIVSEFINLISNKK